MRTLQEEAEAQGFDLKVHHRDKRSGQVTHVNPYKLRIVGEDRLKLYERPVGSGNLWNGQNKAVGRWIVEDKNGEKIEKYDPKAKHIEYTPPMTQDQVLARQVAEREVENATLRAELEAMKLEMQKKADEGAPVGSTGKNAQATRKSNDDKGA